MSLINDLLLYTKIDFKEEIKMNYENVALEELIKEVV